MRPVVSNQFTRPPIAGPKRSVDNAGFDPDSAAFAQGSRLIAHEAWFTRGTVRNPDIHSAAHQAAEVAARAGCERLLLIHLPPFEESVDALVTEAQAVLADVTPARDATAVPGL